MKYLYILLVVLTLTFTIIITIQNNTHSNQIIIQRQGNLTQQMISTLAILIDNSTELYRRYRLVDMANYISIGMKKSFTDQWQVFLFGQNTQNCSFSGNTIFGNQWAVWDHYGIYDLCYVVYRTKSCKINQRQQTQQREQNNLIPRINVKEQQQWGYSFTSADQQRILALLDEANSYGGANMTANSEYFLQRAGSGGWAISIGGPSNGIGMSTCYFRGYYAYIVDYTELLWTYAIIREF